MHDDMVLNRCVSVPFVRKLHSMGLHCYMIYVKNGSVWKINTTSLILKISLPNLQVYARKIVDFISKTEGPVNFNRPVF